MFKRESQLDPRLGSYPKKDSVCHSVSFVSRSSESSSICFEEDAMVPSNKYSTYLLFDLYAVFVVG